MHIVSKIDMPDDHSGATHRTAAPDFGTAGNADAACHGCVIADKHVMGNLDLVIQLDAVPDHRIVQCASIDRRIGANFNVITDHDTTNLRNLDPALAFPGKTKTVAANDCSCLNDCPSANNTVVIDDDVRIKQAIVADGNAVADNATRINAYVLTNPDTDTNDNVFANAGRCGNLRMHNRR